MNKNDTYKVVDKRKLPVMFDSKLAVESGLSYAELGFLVWLMSCKNEGIIEKVFERYYGVDETFTKRADKMNERGYFTFSIREEAQ